MNIIKLLILTISLKSTYVSSSICSNHNITCIELCCGMEQTYSKSFGWCRDLPEFARAMWLATIRNITQTEEVIFIEYGECSASSDEPVIDICYGPKYYYGARDIVLVEYSNVSCDRLMVIRRGWLLLQLSVIFLPFMLLLLYIKKDKKNKLSYKLISWYLTVTIASLLLWELWSYIQFKIKSEDSPLIFLCFLHNIFLFSTFLWLSCIGYNVYVQFTETNIRNRERKDQRRFIWFSIFVWVGTLMICILDEMLRRLRKFARVHELALFVFACFNVFAFLVLSLKITLIRCRIIGISTEKHIKCKLARIICRLCILMGIPRMIFTILTPVIGMYPLYIVVHMEPFFVYATFMLENENYCVNFFRYNCCSCASENEDHVRPELEDNANEDDERPEMENITMRNPNAV